MRGGERTLAVVLVSLWLAGCATSAIDMAPERPDRPWTPATTPDGEIIAGARGTGASDGYVLPANPALGRAPPGPQVDTTKAYSLPALIDLAESNNPTTRIAWNEARRVALAAGVAESAYLPKLNANIIGALQGSDGQDAAQGTNISNHGALAGTVSAVSLQWLLFDFGERDAIIDAAKQASAISNIAYTAAHQQVIYGVTIAFYAHAATRARLATATQTLRNAQAVQAAAENRGNHGIGTVMEVAQARQGTAQARLAVVQATGGAQDAYLTLLTAMGISPLIKIKIADVSGRRLSLSMEPSVEAIISESLSRRPDMQSAYAAQKATLAGIRAARAEFMPKFFLSATGTYASGGLSVTALPSATPQSQTLDVNGNRLGGVLFAGVTVPLYDGGTRAAALAQAHAEADSAGDRLARTRDDATRQIVLADNALHTSLSAHAAAQSLVTAAQTSFNAALTAYRNGVGSITDLTLAGSQLLQAENASTDAYNSALSAAATLALATGTLGAAPQ